MAKEPRYDPHSELDAETAPDLKGTSAANRAEQARKDKAILMEQPEFHRFLLTLTERAGIWTPSYWTQDTNLAQESGRRALGLEVLDDLRKVDPRLDVFLAVEKSKTLER